MENDSYYDHPYYVGGGVSQEDHPYYYDGGVYPRTPIGPTYPSKRFKLLVWECRYCANENLVEVLACRGCGASRVAADVRAFWIL